MADLNTSFAQTYNVHSGVDIVATVNGVVLGNLNGISFSTTREKAPVYVLGSVDAVAFGRGKRGHAGSLIFTNFDRHALKDLKSASANAAVGYNMKYYAKGTDVPAGGRSKILGSHYEGVSYIGKSHLETANYSDQIPPFTITLTGQNEYGKISVMSIIGVELINEGSGISIDDIVTETQMTFVARAIIPWEPYTNDKYGAPDFAQKYVGDANRFEAVRSAKEAANAAAEFGN